MTVVSEYSVSSERFCCDGRQNSAAVSGVIASTRRSRTVDTVRILITLKTGATKRQRRNTTHEHSIGACEAETGKPLNPLSPGSAWVNYHCGYSTRIFRSRCMARAEERDL